MIEWIKTYILFRSLILSSCFFILNKILYAYIINHNMISNYFDEPLVKNYTAPKYPLFIALQNCLNSISNKKSIRDTKSDISSVIIFSCSLLKKSVLRAKNLFWLGLWNLWICPTLKKKLILLIEFPSWLKC